jgi:hypothetical protein
MYRISEKKNGNIVISSTKENKVVEIRPDMIIVIRQKDSKKDS